MSDTGGIILPEGFIKFASTNGAAASLHDPFKIFDPPRQRRGFALLDDAARAEMAQKGGKAAQAAGRSHRWSPETAAKAGKRGGKTLVRKRGRKYMREIGKRGVESRARKLAAGQSPTITPPEATP